MENYNAHQIELGGQRIRCNQNKSDTKRRNEPLLQERTHKDQKNAIQNSWTSNDKNGTGTNRWRNERINRQNLDLNTSRFRRKYRYNLTRLSWSRSSKTTSKHQCWRCSDKKRGENSKKNDERLGCLVGNLPWSNAIFWKRRLFCVSMQNIKKAKISTCKPRIQRIGSSFHAHFL